MRGTATALYARAARSWGRAPGEIARGLREARALHSRERRFVGDALHGMVRMRRRLAWLAGLDAGELASPPPDALYLMWCAGGGEPDAPLALDPPILEQLAALGVHEDTVRAGAARLAEVADPLRRLAIGASYPDWLVARVAGDLGAARAEAFLRASNRRAPLLARANRLCNDRDALAARLRDEGVETAPVPLAPDALELRGQQNAYGLVAFAEGRFELQDVASQLVAEVVAPPPHGRVLDLCAGAGGKTLHLGALLGGAGRVTACDVADHKLEELRRRARRAGLSNVEARRIREAGPLELGAFDRVLVDAPCTGSGVLRRNPEARWRLGPRDLVELPKRQLAILERAAACVAPGGRLVYATCSVIRAENDDVVDGFLAANDAFAPMRLAEILGPERAAQIGDGARLRTAPDTHAADGFFAAVLRRKS